MNIKMWSYYSFLEKINVLSSGGICSGHSKQGCDLL